MKLSRALVVIALSSLASCGFSAAPEPVRYQLQPPALEEASPVAGATQASLRIDPPRASADIDNEHIQLRRADGSVNFIANAAWNLMPGRMLAPLLMQDFAQPGLFGAVVDDTATVATTYELQTKIENFAVIEASQPFVEVSLRADLVRASDNHLLLSKLITERVPIDAVRISAIMPGFTQAVDKALTELTAAIAQRVKLKKTRG